MRAHRVLRVASTRTGLSIVAGIDWGPTSGHPAALQLTLTGPLPATEVQPIKDRVQQGCVERLSGAAPNHLDVPRCTLVHVCSPHRANVVPQEAPTAGDALRFPAPPIPLHPARDC
jgi:hypothetical protein